MNLPSLLNFDGKRITIAVLIVIVLALAAAVRIEHYRAEQANSVYTNPRVIHSVKTVKVAGPVRIVTQVVERPTEKRITTIEYREATIETRGETADSAPVPLSVAMAAPGNAWLVGVGNRDGEFRTWKGYSLWAGRELGTRAQAQLGVGYRDGAEAQAVLLLKLGR